MNDAPSIEAIRELRATLGTAIQNTPTMPCPALEAHLGNGTRIRGKLEFLQHTGTFKARSALAVLSGLTAEQREIGVTAVSAGNHAIATAFAARAVGASAKIVMIGSAIRQRIDICRSYGAELVIAPDAHEAFAMAEEIQVREGRILVHPFEGAAVATGTGTVGLEICEQCDDFDAVIVPIGGGGLIAGVANAVKKLRPECEVFGVEPAGADSMHRSFAAGEPRAIEQVVTIADSLGAPFALPYSFALCRQFVDALVMVDDEALRRSMGLLYRVLKIAVEPACAATTAALFGPLRSRLAGKSVVLVFCGSNIDWATFADQAIFEDADAA